MSQLSPSSWDRPETWLALQGFLVAFFWEMLQMPFFEMADMTGWQQTKACALAAFGDAGIMVAGYLVVRWRAADPLWLLRPTTARVAGYLSFGLGTTIAIEMLAVRVPWGWSYSEAMPLIGGIGVVPLLMWLIVPSIALALAIRLTRAGRGQGPS